MKKRKKTPLPVLISLVVIALIVAVAGFFYTESTSNTQKVDVESYFGISSDSEVPLIVDDKILDMKGIKEGDSVYIDYSTVWHYISAGLYWDSSTQELVLTLPSGTTNYTEGDGVFILKDGTPYISAEFIRDNTDIDMEILSNPTRVVARTNWTDLTVRKVKEDNTYVRSRDSRRGQVLTTLSAGDLVVLVENGKQWFKVSTQDGWIGYVQKDALTDAGDDTITHESDAKFDFGKISLDSPINLAWMIVNSDMNNSELSDLVADAEGLTTVAPTWFSFSGSDGTLTSYASEEYVSTAHSLGLTVWGTLADVYGSDPSAGEILADADARAKTVSQLISEAERVGMDGINIDLETITEDETPQYLQFLRELCVAAHEKNLIVSTDNYVPDYTAYLKRGEQARYVDYIIIMGYDEHTDSSEEAGSVASLSYVENGIQDTLAEVPASQVINAMPFYCRGWSLDASTNTLSSDALSMNQADEFVEKHGINLTWDSDAGQYTGSAEDGTVTYSIWVEDEKSIAEKMKLYQKYNLAGVAEWRLGYERADVWKTIAKYLEQTD